MAPEIVSKKEYAGPPADIWALGVLLYALLCGCFPYRGANDKELSKKICTADCNYPAHLSVGVKTLLKRIFQVDANTRPTSAEL